MGIQNIWIVAAALVGVGFLAGAFILPASADPASRCDADHDVSYAVLPLRAYSLKRQIVRGEKTPAVKASPSEDEKAAPATPVSTAETVAPETSRPSDLEKGSASEIYELDEVDRLPSSAGHSGGAGDAEKEDDEVEEKGDAKV